MTDILCKTCKYWEPPPGPSNAPDRNGMGRCGFVDSPRNNRPQYVAVEALDEHGYSAGVNNSLKTSPWFGCNLYEEVES